MKTSGVIRLQYLSEGKLRQARELRKNMTNAEDLLWQRLRRNQLGVKFRRQQIIQGFIADFFCESAKLVVEVDGFVHDSVEHKKYDEHRRNVFEARGLREIRFKNDQVINDIDNVIKSVQSLLPLSPCGREVGREVKEKKNEEV